MISSHFDMNKLAGELILVLQDSFCSVIWYCVTTGGGGYKIFFGTGTQLIVEKSKFVYIGLSVPL